MHLLVAMVLLAPAGPLAGLGRLANHAAETVPPGARVQVDVQGPPALTRRLSDLLVERLRLKGRVPDSPPGADFKIHLALRTAGDQVVAEGGVVAIGGELWRRIVGAAAEDPVSRIYEEIPLDRELRSLVTGAPPQSARFSVRVLPLPEVDLWALATGDTSGTGETTLVGMTDRELIYWMVGTESLVQLRRVPLGGALPAGPTRSHVAALFVDGRTVIGRSGLGLYTPGTPEDFPLGQAPDRSPLLAPLAPRSELFLLGAPWPARVRSASTLFTGEKRTWFGAVVDESSRLRVYRGAPGAPLFGVEHVGDALALYDTNHDGVPEAATSAWVPPGDEDRIIVHGVDGEKWRSPPIAGGVRCLAAGDFDGDGRAELVAVVRERKDSPWVLWIID